MGRDGEWFDILCGPILVVYLGTPARNNSKLLIFNNIVKI